MFRGSGNIPVVAGRDQVRAGPQNRSRVAQILGHETPFAQRKRVAEEAAQIVRRYGGQRCVVWFSRLDPQGGGGTVVKGGAEQHAETNLPAPASTRRTMARVGATSDEQIAQQGKCCGSKGLGICTRSEKVAMGWSCEQEKFSTWVPKTTCWRDSDWTKAMEDCSWRPRRPTRRRWMKWEDSIRKFVAESSIASWSDIANDRTMWSSMAEGFAARFSKRTG